MCFIFALPLNYICAISNRISPTIIGVLSEKINYICKIHSLCEKTNNNTSKTIYGSSVVTDIGFGRPRSSNGEVSDNIGRIWLITKARY